MQQFLSSNNYHCPSCGILAVLHLCYSCVTGVLHVCYSSITLELPLWHLGSVGSSLCERCCASTLKWSNLQPMLSLVAQVSGRSEAAALGARCSAASAGAAPHPAAGTSEG